MYISYHQKSQTLEELNARHPYNVYLNHNSTLKILKT